MTSEGAPVVEIRDLRVHYGQKKVLGGVDLRLEPGEALALIGRNGVGKSSLTRCLLGQQKPSGGSVRVFGQDVWRRRAALMERCGVVPEDGDAPPAMTPRQLARFSAPLYPTWDRGGFTARLERFSIPLGTPFGQLSRGQKTQVMFALALASSPEFLILDDPTLGLDAVARRAVFEELVDELADRGTTLFFTSHDLPGIESVATRVAILSDGALPVDEDLESLKSRHRWILVDEDTDVGPLGPTEESSFGRRRRVLVSRWDQEEAARLLGPAPEVQAASLEEIVVSLGDVGSGAAA
ncbi:MAG: ABC transporter ATP-binding protein [Acidobacteriota bacterium]